MGINQYFPSWILILMIKLWQPSSHKENQYVVNVSLDVKKKKSTLCIKKNALIFKIIFFTICWVMSENFILFKKYFPMKRNFHKVKTCIIYYIK